MFERVQGRWSMISNRCGHSLRHKNLVLFAISLGRAALRRLEVFLLGVVLLPLRAGMTTTTRLPFSSRVLLLRVAQGVDTDQIVADSR